MFLKLVSSCMVAAVHVRQEYASVQRQSQHFLPHQTYPTRDISVTMEIWVTVQKNHTMI